MGNADLESPHKRLFFNEYAEPRASIDRPGYGMLMYEYEELRTLGDLQSVVSLLDTEEMREFVRRNGYAWVEWQSAEGQEFLQKVSATMQEQLRFARRIGETTTQANIQIDLRQGMPVMVERTTSDRNPVLNCLFAIVKREDNGVTKRSFLTHPILIDAETHEVSVAEQRRSDDNRFQPPLWIIEENTPFGDNMMVGHRISYPYTEVEK